jgi:hypothetical protein
VAVSKRKFRPDVTPEWWIPPITGCRFSTLTTGARFQSLDEYFTKPSGQRTGKPHRTRVMAQLRRYGAEHRGESVAEADGYSWDDAVYAYKKMFPGWRCLKVGLRPNQIKDYLKAGHFISVSGNVGRTPAGSILRAAVNPVPHEIGLARLNTDGTKVLVYEPMRRDKPVWVPWSDVKAFSSAFTYDNGRRYCIALPIGWATDSATIARAELRRAKRLRGEIEDAKAQANAFEDMLDSANTEIAALEVQLANCDSDPDAAYDAALANVLDAVEALREDGYTDG